MTATDRVWRIVKRATIGPLQTDAVVRRYGWAVLGCHAAAFLFLVDTRALQLITDHVEPLCWPYFERCWQYRLPPGDAVTWLAVTYLSLVIAAAVGLACRFSRFSWVVLLVLNLVLFGLMSLDYRLRANEFYMLFWLNGVFLFAPSKRLTIPLIIVSFYFWAGTLKLNYEWLSGSVLYHDLFLIPPRFNWLACWYVVVLEIAMTWGLLAERAWLRWGALAQLALFHIQSLTQIHWFYPLLMASILAWFPLAWTSDARGAGLATLSRGRTPVAAFVVAGLFAACQLVPWLYRGDRALTGQGRIFALHMFEARQECDVSAVLHRQGLLPETIDLKMYSLAPREICDPVVYFSRAQNLCRQRISDPTLADIDVHMQARRRTDKTLRTVIDEPDFCSKGYTYSLLFNNPWLK